MSDPRDSGEFASPPPRRWLDGTDAATARERDVLRSGADLDPPAGADRKVWMALAAKIGPIGGAGGGGAPGPAAPAAASAGAKGAASAASGGGGIVTSALIGAACALAVLAGSSALDNRDRPTPALVSTPAAIAPAPRKTEDAPQALVVPAPTAAPAPAAARVDPIAPIAPSPALKPGDPAPARSPEPAATPRVARPADAVFPVDPGGSGPAPDSFGSLGGDGATAAADRASRLREESQLLAKARDALRAGDVGRCFAQLEEARTRFPAGGLGQEREALTIEALARSGNRALAAERAAAFLRAYPTSPHAARVRTFAQY